MSLLESKDLESITRDNPYKLDNETFITNVLICSLTDEELIHNVNMLYEKAKSVNIDVKILKNRLEDCAKKLNIVLPKHTACLKVISAPDLQKANLPPIKFLINDILPEGTSMISAPSKIGKSWFVLDMGLSIASGMPFMKYNTNKAGVLYLALEDSLSRLQNRMNKVLNGAKAPEHFYFTTESPTLDDGLIEVLEEHLKSFPETKLIIIDTLQKIRGQALPRESAYAQDYREMAVLKSFADKHCISTFFVHHTRKMKDTDDAFNMISGTNGIMGAADTIFVMTKDKRDDSKSESDFVKREQELTRRELHMTAKEMLSEKGLPVQLFDALNCTDKETIEKSIATVEKVFNDHKANVTSNIKFKGFQPGAGLGIPDVMATEDIEIRKAMGLRNG